MNRDPVTSRPATPLWRSFGHAWDGLADAAATQRNMRIHLVAAALAGSFAALAPLSGAERALIALCMALVIAAEAGNTALEALVDLHGGPPSEPARIAKDAAAGAVLALAVASVAVFAFVAARHRPELAAAWREVLRPALAGLGLAVLTAVAGAGFRGSERATRLLAVTGVILVTLLACTAECPASALLPAAPLAIALAGRNRRPACHER